MNKNIHYGDLPEWYQYYKDHLTDDNGFTITMKLRCLETIIEIGTHHVVKIKDDYFKIQKHGENKKIKLKRSVAKWLVLIGMLKKKKNSETFELIGV